MSGYPFTGPIAPENNPAIEPQWFQPSAFNISAIVFGTSTTVTTTTSFGVDNNYVIGQLVRFVMPSAYGARQLNDQTGYVIDLPATNQVTININTTQGYDPFISSPSYGPTPPQLIAIGDISSGSLNTTGRSNNGTTTPGAFINISPSAGG